MRSGPLLVSMFLFGCGEGGVLPESRDGGPAVRADGGGSSGSDGPSGDGGFAPAPHLPFPSVTLHTGSVLSTPELVTITYSDFVFRDKVEQFGDFVVTSKWLDAVGKEYGVGKGVHRQKVRLADPAPPMLTDAQIGSFLVQQAKAGALPAPSAQDSQLIYLFYLPGTTKVDDGTGTRLCVAAYDGYHDTGHLNGFAYGYAVLVDCEGDLDSLTDTASHEIIESATDPSDGWFLDVGQGSHWSGLNTAEVGDLCEDYAVVKESGWALQRSWSNAAAMAGASPCVPIPAGEVFFDVTPMPPSVVSVPAGQSTTFTLTGWSTAPVHDWSITASVPDTADFDPMAVVAKGAINNGTSLTVTLSVPKGTPPGVLGSVQIYNGPVSGNYWPITVLSQ